MTIVYVEGHEVLIESESKLGKFTKRLSFGEVTVAAQCLREHLLKLMPPVMPGIEIDSAGWRYTTFGDDIPVPPGTTR